MSHVQSTPAAPFAARLGSAPLWARAARIALGAAVLTAASHLRLPFALTPVPFTLQPQAVLAIAAALGATEGVAAVLAWLSLGAMGAPVFASALPGVWALMGPTGGYLAAHVPVAYVVGRWGRGQNFAAAGVWLLATAFTLALGGAWLGRFVGFSAAWSVGVMPFVATDLYKACALFLARRLSVTMRRGSARAR